MVENPPTEDHRDDRRTFLKTVSSAIAVTSLESGAVVAKQPRSDKKRSESWTSLRSNPERTGAVDTPGPRPYATTDWKMHLGGSMDAIDPIVADKTVYLAVTTENSPSENEGYIGAYSTTTGDRRWKRTGVPRPKTPSISDGTLYFATRVSGTPDPDRGGFYALNAESGDTEWKRTGEKEWITPVLTPNRVYTANENGAYALDTKTGATLWKTDDIGGLANGAGGSLSYTNGTVFFSDGTALDAADGSVKWRATTENRTFGNHAVSDNRVYYIRTDYVQGDDDRVVVEARSARTGDVDWTYTANGRNRWDGRVAIANGFVILVSSNDRNASLKALDAKTGTIAWTTDLYGEFFSNPSVSNGTVFIGGRYIPQSDPTRGRAVIYAIEVTTGKKKWIYVLDSSDLRTTPENPPAAGTPVISDGNIYTATYPAGATARYRYLEYSNFFALKSWGKWFNEWLPQDSSHKFDSDTQYLLKELQTEASE